MEDLTECVRIILKHVLEKYEWNGVDLISFRSAQESVRAIVHTAVNLPVS